MPWLSTIQAPIATATANLAVGLAVLAVLGMLGMLGMLTAVLAGVVMAVAVTEAMATPVCGALGHEGVKEHQMCARRMRSERPASRAAVMHEGVPSSEETGSREEMDQKTILSEQRVERCGRGDMHTHKEASLPKYILGRSSRVSRRGGLSDRVPVGRWGVSVRARPTAARAESSNAARRARSAEQRAEQRVHWASTMRRGLPTTAVTLLLMLRRFEAVCEWWCSPYTPGVTQCDTCDCSVPVYDDGGRLLCQDASVVAAKVEAAEKAREKAQADAEAAAATIRTTIVRLAADDNIAISEAEASELARWLIETHRRQRACTTQQAAGRALFDIVPIKGLGRKKHGGGQQAAPAVAATPAPPAKGSAGVVCDWGAVDGDAASGAATVDSPWSPGTLLELLRARAAAQRAGHPFFSPAGAIGVPSGGAVGPVRRAVPGHPNAGWAVDFYEHTPPQVAEDGTLRIQGNTRAYLVQDAGAVEWSQHKYARIDLRDRLSFELDLSKVCAPSLLRSMRA